ncbi:MULTISPECIES: PilZ domain-containing protein [Pseudomonas]|jgi:Tfp pilus assembly protein PilZ|uniref:PilZ domain-containing protein n=2 Tax=Pseudomonas TaxID=286 RepID=A0A9X8ELI9_PSEPU|nr:MULTISPECIES: PilZ domain-containing protein [Pseudomonas]KIU42715.1 pilus assembly protein [Pseudomonas putida]KTC22757.1 pilus assembly protein [Pseudomonas putida]MBG8559767.1 PilZ domain-containing protein [Pseudomonas qingdaonensis]MCO7503145.1 PilZ domain-containing protein [Pseudomonas sp. VE 267-6A]MCO7532423.1 PilZ domain-containing protein [Pseudomonas sp. 2]
MSQNHADYSEKRDFIRMRVDTDVTLIHAEQVIAAVCLDLSSSGMQVQAAKTFQVGDNLSVSIDSDHPSLKGLHATTQVVWIADQPQGQQKLGLKILAMS